MGKGGQILCSCKDSRICFANKEDIMDIRFEKRPVLKEKPDQKNLGFGKYMTDYMFVMDWTKEDGWKDARIVPEGPITMDPACVTLHYAQETFEGMKAYRTAEGKIQLFRPLPHNKINALRRLQIAAYLFVALHLPGRTRITAGFPLLHEEKTLPRLVHGNHRLIWQPTGYGLPCPCLRHAHQTDSQQRGTTPSPHGNTPKRHGHLLFAEPKPLPSIPHTFLSTPLFFLAVFNFTVDDFFNENQ